MRSWGDTMVRDREDALMCTVTCSPTWSYMVTLEPGEGDSNVSTALVDLTVVAGSAAVSVLGPDLVAVAQVTELPRGVRRRVKFHATRDVIPGAVAVWSMPSEAYPTVVRVHDVAFSSRVLY